MSQKLRFYFEKSANDILLTRYQVSNSSSWFLVDEQYQELEFHQTVCEKPIIARNLSLMVKRRTISVQLTADEAQPYIEKRFGSECEDDDTEDSSQPDEQQSQTHSEPSSSSTDTVILSAVSEMMRVQQEMFTNALKCFQQTLNSRSTSQKLEITKFDGKSEDATTWMRTYEKMCEHNNWTKDSSKINGLKSNLEGNALKWYNSMVRDEIEEDWCTWKYSFLGSFGENRLSAALAADKWEYRTGPTLDYFFEKQRLIQIGYPMLDEFNFVTKVMLGLPEDMQTQVMAKQPKTKMDLRKAFEQLKPAKVNKPTTLPFKAKDNRSYKFKDASKPKESMIVGIPPHTPSFDKSPVIDSRTQLFVNGKPFSCRLDSGADLNLVSLKTVVENNWKVRPINENALTFNNALVNITQACDITITLAGSNRTLEFGVVNELPHCFILGEPAMILFGIGLRQEKTLEQPLCAISMLPKLEIRSFEDVYKYFPNLCSNRLSEPTHSVPFKLNDNPTVVQCRAYRLSEQRYKWLQNHIQELIDKNIIRKSTSAYASPTTLARKENGDWRFCVDFREINKQTILDPYPFPIIDDVINRFGGCRFFSKIDLKDGFWQIGLTEESRHFSAFVTPFGHYEWNRLPFGWKNSPAIFQRWINTILEETPSNPLIAVYIDDICIGAKTESECAQLTGKVLEKLAKAGATININKTLIGVPKVKFLGRLIDGTTKTTRQESIEKVQQMLRPYDVHTLRQFTGLTGHFRAYIKGYATLVRPLEALKKKDVPFVWSSECQEVFDKLKEIITANPVLQLPDPDLPYELCTDACGSGTGSILYQRDKTLPRAQQLRVIGYQSYTFSPAEKNYMITEQEALAVIKAIKYFRSYLENKPFIVHTDHMALKYLMDLKEPKGRLARWQVFLMGFEITFNHKPGRLLTDADAVSRLCNLTPNVNLICKPENGTTLVRKFIDDPGQKAMVLSAYHDEPESGGHDGFLRTYYKIKARFQWPKMKNDIKEYIKSCPVCQKVKPQRSQDVPFFPNHSTIHHEVIHIDFGELEKKSDTNKTTKSFLLAVDEATRTLVGKAMRENSKSVIDFLESQTFITQVKTIVSDNGTAFTSKQFKQWASDKQIKLKNTSPYHPAANGLVERRMKDIKQFIKLYSDMKGNWKDKLSLAIRHANRAYCSSLGMSPLEMLLKKPIELPADKIFGINSSKLQLKPHAIRKLPTIKETTHSEIKNGDKIMVRFGFKGKERVTKGPFEVIKVCSYDGNPKTIIYLNEHKEEAVAHISNIKLFHERTPVLQSGEM